MSGKRKSMRIEGSVSWSQMMHNMQKLDLADYLNFGKICTTWRSVFLSRCSITPPPPFMVLISKKTGWPIELPLWCLHEGQFQKFQSPKTKSVGGSDQAFVGSYMGWLVVISKIKPGLEFVNSTTNEWIPLPSMASDGFEMGGHGLGDKIFTVFHVVMSTAPTSNDCILVARGCHGSRPRSFAWCRVGGSEWSLFHQLADNLCTCDMVFHKGALYVLAKEGEIFVYTFDPQPKLIDRCSVGINNFNHKGKFVESGEELFSVLQDHENNKWYAFKMLNDGQWTRVESLCDRVFLIGKHGGRSYFKQELMGSKF